MPDWITTLALREQGRRPGFYAANVPLEDQDDAEDLTAEAPSDALAKVPGAKTPGNAAKTGSGA